MTPYDYKTMGRNLPAYLFGTPEMGVQDTANWLYDKVEYCRLGRPFDTDMYPDTQDWYRDLVKQLRDAGWTRLGSGYFSAVFKHPHHPGLAFKVGFKKEDSGAAYAAWCRANQDKGYAIPEILLMMRRKLAYIVVMPEYKEFYHDDGSLSAAYSEAQRFMFHDQDVTTARTAVTKTAHAIRKFFYGMATLDLHSGNVMVDDKGQLVITDPVSMSEGTAKGADPDVWVAERMRRDEARRAPVRIPNARWYDVTDFHDLSMSHVDRMIALMQPMAQPRRKRPDKQQLFDRLREQRDMVVNPSPFMLGVINRANVIMGGVQA